MSATVWTGPAVSLCSSMIARFCAERVRADRLADRGVELAAVNDARFVAGEARIGEHRLESVGAEEALGHFRRRPAHRDPTAVRWCDSSRADRHSSSGCRCAIVSVPSAAYSADNGPRSENSDSNKRQIDHLAGDRGARRGDTART